MSLALANRAAERTAQKLQRIHRLLMGCCNAAPVIMTNVRYGPYRSSHSRKAESSLRAVRRVSRSEPGEADTHARRNGHPDLRPAAGAKPSDGSAEGQLPQLVRAAA